MGGEANVPIVPPIAKNNSPAEEIALTASLTQKLLCIHVKASQKKKERKKNSKSIKINESEIQRNTKEKRPCLTIHNSLTWIKK